MREFDVLTDTRKVYRAVGETGEDACERVADLKRVTVIAWREPRVQLNVGAIDTIEESI